MENNDKKPAVDATQPTPEELAAMQSAQGEVLAAQEKRIAQLMADLEAEKANKGETKVMIVKEGVPVTVNKKQYLVVHGLIYTDKKLSVDQIAADKDLCAKLVASNSSAIKAV